MPKHRRATSKTNANANTDTNAKSHETPRNPSLQPQQHLPPSRQGKATKRTVAPLYKASFNNFIYSLTAVVIFLFAFYTYRIMIWKTQAGGWWNLATGQRAAPPTSGDHSSSRGGNGINENNIELKISELASAFGIPPATLAMAIASAVSAHAAPASLSSSESEAPMTSALQSLVKDETREAKERMNGYMNKLSDVVGIDDPGAGLD